MLGTSRMIECTPTASRMERVVVTASPTISTPPGVPVADACTITPALRTWIECLVDARVDQSCNSFRERDFANLVSSTRREAAAASQSAMVAVQQSDQSRQRLEMQVRNLADAQARLLAVVENFSGDAERQHSCSNKARAEALVTVERVMTTVDELQRTVEQDGDAANARLRQHDTALDELRRLQSEDSMKNRATIAELQRLHSESSQRQRQCSEELAGACSSIAATRQEVGDLAQMVQRLEHRLQGWREEVAAELSEELGARLAVREAAQDAERMRLESLQREASAATAARIELEARVEGLRVELQGLAPQRAELEPRLREGQLALQRKLEALQASTAKDAEGARRELEELARALERLDQRFGQLRADVSKEIRLAPGAREAAELAREQGAAALEGLKREVSQQWAEIEHRFERLHVEVAAAAATRESFEFRIREGQEEVKKLVDKWQGAWQGSLRNELEALQNQIGKDHECVQGEIREELAQLQRRLSVELRAETRALLKSEQNAISALDEQLWLTDQRLGQRIDELVQAAGRGERIAAAAAAAELGMRSPAPRTPTLASRDRGGATVAGGLLAEAAAVAELAARSPAPQTPSLGPRDRVAALAPEEPVARGDTRRSLVPRLSDAEQLERLRTARRLRTSASEAGIEGAASERSSAARRGLLGGRAALSMAREAAEAFEDLARTGE